VLIERPQVIVDEFGVNPDEVRRLFVRGLQAYTGETNVGSAWAKLGVARQDVVGIKINTAPGRVMGTRRALVDVIVESLGAAGVTPERIIIWDKFRNELQEAAFLPQAEGARPIVKAVVADTGFDGQHFYVNEVLGRLIWGDYLFRGRKPTMEDLRRAAEKVVKKAEKDDPLAEKLPKVDVEEQTSNRSYLAKLVTQGCTKIINVACLIDHSAFGIDGCLSSLAMGSVDNTRRFQAEAYAGDPAIPEILDRAFFRKKVALHLLDGMLGQYAGGPEFTPLYSQRPGALCFSRDPVAIDGLALRRLETWRTEAKIVLIGDRARHVKIAGELGLGESDLEKIELVKVE